MNTKTLVRTVEAVTEELDVETVRQAAALGWLAVLRLIGWYLCGKGYHHWQWWEYEDGTVTKACSSCDREVIQDR